MSDGKLVRGCVPGVQELLDHMIDIRVRGTIATATKGNQTVYLVSRVLFPGDEDYDEIAAEVMACREDFAADVAEQTLRKVMAP